MSTATPARPVSPPPPHATAILSKRRALAEALTQVEGGASTPTTTLAAIDGSLGLGFGRLAGELVGRIADQLDPSQRDSLDRAIRAGRSGVEPKAVSRARLRRNLEALHTRAKEIGDAWDEITANAERWIERTLVLRDVSGTTIAATLDDDDRIDLETLASRLRPLGAAPPVRDSASLRFPPPLLFLGAWPWTTIEIARQSDGDRFNGYRPRIDVVEPKTAAFFGSIVACDMVDAIDDDRIRLWIGADAPSRLIDHLIDDPDAPLPERVLELNGDESTQLFAQWSDIERSRSEYEDRLRRHAAEIYSKRDTDWWRRRFDHAGRDGSEPLRVLVPVSRYSTYIRQAGRQLAAAFERIGCEARVLSERDASSTVSPSRYLETLCDWTPDLVVQIDHLRHEMSSLIPDEVEIPFVCWAQDKLRNIFNEDSGRRVHRMEFVVGIGTRELVTRYGYPADQVAPALNVTDPSVFSNARVDESELERFHSDIAWVTNHSTPPDALEPELRARFNLSEQDESIFENVSNRIRQIFESGVEPTLYLSRRELLTNAAPELMTQYSRDALEQVYQYFATPLFDRWYRHQTLDWLVEYAERTGATLRLYGAGWENWPTTASYAAGSIEPGRELRLAYQAAKVHIHASAFGSLHQRVFDGFAAGGFVLCRMTQNDRLSTLWKIAARDAARIGVDRLRTSESRELTAFFEHEFELNGASPPDRRWNMDRRPVDPGQAGDPSASLSFDSIVPDFHLVSFQSQSRLFDRLDELCANDQLRSERAQSVRAHIVERLSVDDLAKSIIGRMTSRLRAIHSQ
ncbi:MAG: hypothetical protein ACF8PN_13635 [Phycisphaerales bacterium]